MSRKSSWSLHHGDEIVAGRVALARLGGGTRFEVYRAIDEHLAAIVVVKMLRPDMVEDPGSLRMLQREAVTLRRLGHPVIVRSFGAVTEGPRPHLVLEHIEGPPLCSLLKRFGPLSFEQVVQLAVELCSALQYLKAEGFVHLDIKPANIVMSAQPRLIDLSIARRVERATRLSRPVGTPSYMAPEQCEPDTYGGVGHAADVWGLGATLYEAISRRSPFAQEGSNARAPRRLRFEPDPLPPRTPTPLVDAVLSCLVMDPIARPTPGDLAVQLEPLLSALPRRPVLGRRRPRLAG